MQRQFRKVADDMEKMVGRQLSTRREIDEFDLLELCQQALKAHTGDGVPMGTLGKMHVPLLRSFGRETIDRAIEHSQPEISGLLQGTLTRGLFHVTHPYKTHREARAVGGRTIKLWGLTDHFAWVAISLQTSYSREEGEKVVKVVIIATTPARICSDQDIDATEMIRGLCADLEKLTTARSQLLGQAKGCQEVLNRALRYARLAEKIKK